MKLLVYNDVVDTPYSCSFAMRHSSRITLNIEDGRRSCLSTRLSLIVDFDIVPLHCSLSPSSPLAVTLPPTRSNSNLIVDLATISTACGSSSAVESASINSCRMRPSIRTGCSGAPVRHAQAIGVFTDARRSGSDGGAGYCWPSDPAVPSAATPGRH